MNKAIAWFARNGVAANLLAVLVVAGGLITVGHIKKEVFPEFSSDLINVSVVYPGAAPAEVEEGICVRIEEAIQSLEGIKQITSHAGEGLGTVRVELLPNVKARDVMDDIKTRVDAIDTFPVEAERPIVEEVLLRKQVINVAVSGPADEATLKRLGERVRDEISALPGVTQVELANARPYEISIEISEEALRRYGLTFDDVARAVRRSSLDLPGGSIKTSGGEILLRSKGQAYRGPDFEKLVLRTNPDGSRLELGDVGRVVDGFAETDQSARFDGQRSVLVQVFRVGDQSALDLSSTVSKYVEQARGRLPEGIQLTTWQDDASYLRSRLDLLQRNARNGLILVFLVLALFLRFRLAFWVTLGIPVSFIGSIWLMPTLDVSINLISLFAFIVVLGIVVDDAIVIGENVHTYQHHGKPGLIGAIEGAQELAVPVVFAVLTTVAAFYPLISVEGNTGKVMRVIPLIVIPTLLFSLTESLFILPSHLSGLTSRMEGRHTRGIAGWWDRFQFVFVRSLDWFIRRVYQRLLDLSLRWRYLTVALAVATLFLTFGLMRGGWIRFYFFPPVEGDNVAAMVTMPLGTPVEVTAEAVRRLEEAAWKVRDEIEKEPGQHGLYRHVLASVGQQPFRANQSRSAGGVGTTYSGSHLGEVHIEVAPSEERHITSTEIANRWRAMTGPVPNAVELVFTASVFSSGQPINIQFTGPDIDELKTVADQLKLRLADYPAVFDISDSFRAGKEEIKLAIKPEAEALGLTLADLARQVRQAFYGEEAQRIQRGRDDIKVMVRYPAGARRSLGDLENMRIRTPDGHEVAFSAVAQAHPGRGYADIKRVDRRRAVNVTADVDPAKGEPDKIIADLENSILRDIQAEHPRVRYTFEGARREQADTLGGLIRGFFLALVIIYGLLAIPFKSYLQPIIVMTAIPFGIVGAVWGHVIMGMDLTVLSMFGLVALTGVVVNDSLVMVDYVNRKRRQGVPIGTAVRNSGVARFRPILLTSLTTFAGLTPLLLERSVQAKFLVPMAISLGFGVMFSTFITLLLVPSGYIILEDLKEAAARLFPAKPLSPPRSPAGLENGDGPGLNQAKEEEEKRLVRSTNS
jgi:multidrug efflux pump subunit AcrB